ncbi:MAG: TetR/AcrR family transcriptional regulator [Maledivibacter sp.]|jgi:AcrR family transcriptional regulator|nr:TetR/AcrR family transcriptional regulator [Maledivibacter sp.]
MQVLKEEVKKQIQNAAIEVFLEKGFTRASMKSIAQRADTSVSNIYNYFEGKEKLYYSIVDPICYDIKRLLDNFNGDEDNEDFSDINFIEQFIKIVANGIGSLIKSDSKKIVLIFDKSEGTKYEKLKYTLIGFLENHFTISLEQEKANSDVSFVMHIIATNLVEGFLEIVRHYKNDKWVDDTINDFIKYHLSGMHRFYE